MTNRKKLLDDILQIDWSKVVSRENSPLMSSLIRVGPTVRNVDLEFDNTIAHHLVLGRDIYASASDQETLKQAMEALAQKDIDFIERYLDRAEDDCNKYMQYVKSLAEQTDDKNVSRGDLLRLFQEYCAQTYRIGSHIFPPLGIEEYIVTHIHERLAQYIDAETQYEMLQAYAQDLITSDILSLFQEKELAQLEIAQEYKNEAIKLRSKYVMDEYRKFNWINDHNMYLDVETPDHFIETIKEMSKYDPGMRRKITLQEFSELRERKNYILKLCGYDAVLAKLSGDAARLPHIRFFRIDVMIQGGHMLRENFYKRIEDVLEIESISDMYLWDIMRCLTNDAERIECYKADEHKFVNLNGKVQILTAEERAIIEEDMRSKQNVSHTLRGSVACKGNVTGEVRVILGKDEFSKFEAGTILVTSMTVPEYVPLMKDALAIITDEGGISCHAAIIARELNKPCIIGTKMATQVLKDGMKVEVDAEKGLVTIIE